MEHIPILARRPSGEKPADGRIAIATNAVLSDPIRAPSWLRQQYTHSSRLNQ